MSELAVDFCSDLPASWTVAAIQEVTEMNPKLDVSNFEEDRPVHFVPMAAVTEDFGGLDVSQLRPLREVKKGYTYFSEGDVIFAKITPCMENGKGAVVPKLQHDHAFGSTEFHVLRPNSAIANKWLAYYISQPDFRRVARHNMTGTAGQLRVPSSWLSSAGLPIAPRAEQTRIVEKLEELLSDLDAGVAELKAAQRKLAQYRQSLLKAAVEGALTADWRAARSTSSRRKPGSSRSRDEQPPKRDPGLRRDDEGKETGAELLQRILSERRTRWEQKQLAKFAEQGKTPPKGWKDKYPEPVAPDLTDLPSLPEGWVWASLEQLTSIQGGIQKQPSRAPVENCCPFLRVANVARGQLKLDEVHEIEVFHGELERFALKKGDLLVVEGNGSINEIGRCAVWDGSIDNAVHQNHLIRARPIISKSEFIEAWLNSHGGIQKMTSLAATTSGLYTLSVGKISKIPVPLPPLSEQEATMEILAVLISECDEQLAATGNLHKKAFAQRKNILKAAFSGQLVPQDPNDEPASVLLARIRAQREANAGTPARKRGRKARGAT